MRYSDLEGAPQNIGEWLRPTAEPTALKGRALVVESGRPLAHDD